jgi:glycosyltransferase involved in cell wall biosynthesis
MRVCMVAYSFYESDNRVMRYAETLAARGDEVDVLSLRQNHDAPNDILNGVRVHRIQRREMNERRKSSYLGRTLKFLALSSWFLAKKHHERPYDLIHVHSVPDFEVFAAFFPKLRGAKVILDIHDIVPEFYASKFGVSKQALSFRILKVVERWSAAFSDHVIIANHLWEKVLTQRAVKPAKCSTYLNYPDSSLFNTSLRTRKDDGRIVMMYPGTLNWHQGVDIAVKAFDIIKNQVPEAEFHIYGDGGTRTQLLQLVEERKLQAKVKLMGNRPIREIAGIMANADIGIVPKRDDSFGGDAFSTKIFEFMALGVPVIAANTRIDRYYFNESIIKFFQAGDETSLASAMITMIRGRNLRKLQAENALVYVAGQSWDVKRQDYLDLVDRLVNNNPEKSSSATKST